MRISVAPLGPLYGGSSSVGLDPLRTVVSMARHGNRQKLYINIFPAFILFNVMHVAFHLFTL